MQILNFLHNKKFTCANFTFFAQQKIHLCKFRIFCTTK
nr:MAG TPA: hypothetical protein [Caudoviricetes sp.]